MAGTAVSVAIGVLLAGGTVVLARESKQLLVGETADAEVIAALRATVGAHPKVRRIFVRPEPRLQDSAAL